MIIVFIDDLSTYQIWNLSMMVIEEGLINYNTLYQYINISIIDYTNVPISLLTVGVQRFGEIEIHLFKIMIK